jgi:dinuclear metal center YbgI/SA1388 family protein
VPGLKECRKEIAVVVLNQLTNYLNELLDIRINDYCPNGLQVQGQENIGTLVTGVSANQALIEVAIELDADAILVHHGFFWKNENPCITGIKLNRIRSLIQNKISLLAYHLPLDVHKIYGNNIQLAHVLHMTHQGCFEIDGLALGYLGELQQAITGEIFARQIEQKLQRKPFYIPGKSSTIHKIAWCTGAAQDLIFHAIEHGVDAYLTGEVSERTVPIAKESGIHFYAAGHHATERYGVDALGAHLSQKFGLKHHFIDIENPV